MKRSLVVLVVLFAGLLRAQITADSLISFIYQNWPDVREYIEENVPSYAKTIEQDTVLSSYLRIWKAYSGARLLEVHSGTNILAIIGLSNSGGVVLDTFKVDEYYFICSKPITAIPDYWNKVLRRLESQ
jgi:hypothetical protein